MKMQTIRSISYLNERSKSRRQLKIRLSDGTLGGTAVIRAESCEESWQQWGGTERELFITMPIVEAHNDWLHGGDRPQYEGATC